MSCEYRVGIDEGGKNTSRVLAPPGGKDSISFSSAPSPNHGASKVNPCQAARNSSNVFESNDIGVQSKGNVKSCQEARQKSSVFTAPLEQIPVPKRGHNGSKSHGNILVADNSGQDKVHTSVHVKAPPGGVSHISFG